MTKICFVGTSLFQQGDQASTVRMAHSTRSWVRWAQRLSGWRVESPVWHAPYVVEGWEPSGVADTTRNYWGLNAGVSGQSIDDIIARLPDIQKIPADEYHIGGATNTVSSLTYTVQELLDKVVHVARTLSSTGKPVKIYTVLARAESEWADPSDQRTLAEAYNALLKEQKEFEVVDWNEGWLDYTAANSVPATGNSYDGTHIGGKGALAIAKPIAARWIQDYPPVEPLLVSPTECLFANAFLQGTAGTADTGVTGDIADDMRGQRTSGASTAVASKDVDSSVRGAVQNIVFTPSAVDDTSEIHFRTETADTPHTLAGEWVQGTVKIRINSANDVLDAITLTVDDLATNGVETNDLYDTGDGFPEEATDGFIELRTPPLKLLDTSTAIRVRLEFFVNGLGTGTADVDIAEFGVVQVQSPEYEYDCVAPNSRVVAPGLQFSTPRGLIPAGGEITSTDVGGNGRSILNLETAGILTSA